MEAYLKKLERQVRERPQELALYDFEGDGFTYLELAAAIEKYRIFFRESGIEKGQKIALCGRNCARWAIAFLAVNTYGAVVVPILPNYTPEGIATLVRHSDSVLLITDKNLWDKMRNLDIPGLKGVVGIGEEKLIWNADSRTSNAWERRQELFNELHPSGLDPYDVEYPDTPEEISILNYTSGTSGDPKGVMLPYRAMSDIIEYCQTTITNKPESILSMLPLAHIYGLAMELIYPCCTGFRVCFLGRTPSPTLLMKAMSEVKPFLVVTVPLVMEKIHSQWIRPLLSTARTKVLGTVPKLRLSGYKSAGQKVLSLFGGHLGTLIIGGAPLSWKVESDLRRIGLPYVVAYGLTECCPLISMETPQGYVAGSCGKPLHEVRIDSSDPEKVPGEIQSRGPNIFVGYYKNPEADKAAFTADGWFCTGDLGVMDEGGNLFIRGRIKALILSSSGQNIYPEDIESALSLDPLVEESVVLLRAGKIVALVYPTSGTIPGLENEEQIERLCNGIRDAANSRLPAFSQIFRVEFSDVPFERTAKGSIKRYLYQ